MRRKTDLDRFYRTLSELQEKLGGFRYLRDCTGKSGWPKRGIYFFFENDEWRNDQSQLQVVRVGTHALTDTSKTTLWNRLRAHRGSAYDRGNHRGSIFQDEVGRAIMKLKRSQSTSSCYGRIPESWGHGRNAEKSVCLTETALTVKNQGNLMGALPILPLFTFLAR